MREITRSREPQPFAAFRCLGADCEDTCCDGWAVTIDQPTYEKYQRCSDPAWRASLLNLITITPQPTTHDYARIQLASTTCPFLSEGLCSIHKNLGEEYLSVTCASFPRVWNAVDDVLEKSLDLGCPEAARQALCDPAPMTFLDGRVNSQDFSTARISAIDSAAGPNHGKPYQHFAAVRRFVLWLLQNRAFPVWKRLLLLGFFCDKVEELSSAGAEAQLPELVQSYQDAISGGLFEDLLTQLHARPVLRLETVLELIVARITSDFTNRRFLACYKEFMEGIRWGSDSTMEEIGARYQEAYSQYAAPFWNTHEHMLEQYLVNCACRSLFPFGPQESTYKLRDQNIERSIHNTFMLLAVHFSIIDTLLGGMAGFHQEAFGVPHVIQVVYTFTRTFEHSLTFPEHVIQMLNEKGLNNPQGVAMLVKN
jgi:lysine-N-methylase